MRTISAIAALILVAGSCVALKPGSTGYSATWLSVLGVSGTTGPTDYLHFWNPASLDETDQGPGGNDATSVDFNPDSTNGWNMGTVNADYVLLGGPITNGTSYTITMWIKPDVTEMNANTFGGWILNERDAAAIINSDFQLAYSKSTGNYSFTVYDSNATGQNDQNTNVIDNVWQHLAAVVNPTTSTIELFVDGVSDGSSSLTITPNDSFNGTTSIGTGWTPFSNSDKKYHGSIGKVRIYQRALTQEEIQSEYEADGETGP